MKYIIFAYDYPPNNGGISRLCGEIRKELIIRGEKVLVITCSKGEPQQGVIRVQGRRGILEYRMWTQLKKAYKKGDVIITDTWHPAGMIAETVTKDVFILAHGAEFRPSSGHANTKLWHFYRNKILSRARGVIANSHYTEGLVKQCSPKSNSIAIPLATDAKLFHPTVEKNTSDNILRLCSLSRLEKFKGHDFILKTIAALPEEYRKRLLFEIGGKGDYKEALEKMVLELGLEPYVKFMGFMPDNEVLDFYSRNDVFILCTREDSESCNVEGFGLVFTEAQACGTAAIGTRAGGIPDAICDGVGGWLIEQDNAQELMSILKKLIDNKQYAQSQGKLARKRIIEESDWCNYCEHLLGFIRHNII